MRASTCREALKDCIGYNPDLPEHKKCGVCKDDYEARYLFSGCGHFGLCWACHERMPEDSKCIVGCAPSKRVRIYYLK